MQLLYGDSMEPLTDKTPVSIVGNRADIHAIDYLTDGEGSIDGMTA
jgi:hypothetical protein